MTVATDLYHFWESDLVASANGDILLASGTVIAEQRVLRRLMTNPQLVDDQGDVLASPDYTWHPTYGAGLPREIGGPIDVVGVTAVIQSQMSQEEGVSQSPAPQIAVTPFQNGLNAFIQYNDALSNLPVVLNFDVNN
jgi:hypothetical protein